MKDDKPIRIGNTTIYPLSKKCCKKGCKANATGWKPLLPGGPAYCTQHFPIDYSGPDDFEIPVD